MRYDIEYLYKYSCMALLVMLTFFANAQQRKDTIKLPDTLIKASPVIKLNEDTEAYFQKITIVPKVQLRKVPESIVKAMKKDPDFWYANATPVKKKQPTNQQQQPVGLPFYRQPWFKTMLWIIIITSFVAVVIWYLAVSNVRLFRKVVPSISKAGNEAESYDIFSINYDTEISKALEEENFRLTIRLLYLQTLKMMAEKGIINYKAERTNSEYLWQLQGTPYYNDFTRLTRDFDYTWYGKFQVSEAAFQFIYKDFNTFKSRL